GHLEPPYTLKKVVSNLMQAPIYPVTLDVFQATVSFTEFKSGDDLTCGQAVTMRTAPLNHPNGATGYRVEYGPKSVHILTISSTASSICRMRVAAAGGNA